MLTSNSKENIIKKIAYFIKENQPIYQQSVLNNYGIVKDCKMLPTEIISQYLIQLLNKTSSDYKTLGISKVTREKSYNPEHIVVKEQNSNRNEEWNAKRLVQNKDENVNYGMMLEFQIPLKNINPDEAGKIDLVSYKKESNEFFIHELKDKTSKESLLKAVLEIYSYYLIVDREKLLSDFNHDGAKIIPTVLIYSGSKAYSSFIEKDKNPYLHKLINKLGIQIHTLQE